MVGGYDQSDADGHRHPMVDIKEQCRTHRASVPLICANRWKKERRRDVYYRKKRARQNKIEEEQKKKRRIFAEPSGLMWPNSRCFDVSQTSWVCPKTGARWLKR